ncbi:AAA family ATPase [Pseudaminobacter sp. 19-2017]|uniref:AAA family ATPase n=1 Tax=Pseudaminobacter soli (ex Zhang et al. 2022) TaxID=2831468 RepID=A0A942I1Q0_9HYPH|nr:AAA family ATPase [Pseudaminobacter soli]MBS3648407.1 AAA family ATPase [Pseudaminobacter soli]
MHTHFVTISGCSGGGKSTLLAELRARGHSVVEEPGRRIVQQELATAGSALPWVDATAFARLAVRTALADRRAAEAHRGWVFFDRGLIDAAAALEHLTGEPVLQELGTLHRYHRRAFLAPPWPEIYVADAERRHGFEAGVEEYQRLEKAFRALDYDAVLLPKARASERADFVLASLQS